MHMSIVEAWQQKLAGSIDDARLRAAPAIHLGRRADTDNALIENRNRLRARMIAIHRPHIGVGDNRFGGGMLLRRNDSTYQNN
jgi:hypothetical protein